MIILLRNIIRIIILVLLQLFVFNNFQLSGYINPYIYILFIILLPFETPGWLLLISGFFLGITMDVFSGTMGMHTSATLFMAFLRPFLLQIISPRDGYEAGSFPRIYYYGFTWFLKYSIALIFAHHFVLFYLEVFQFSYFFDTFLRVIMSTIFSVTLIILSQYVVFRK